MRLRSLTKHIRDQNWFAVALDFCIVVVGILIAFQITNWNEGRAAQNAERAYLVEMRKEVVANNLLQEENLELIKITIASGQHSLTFLEEYEPCAAECWRQLVDFFHASQVPGRLISLSVFEEMLRQGLPRSADIKSAMKIYATATRAQSAISQTLPLYREHVRGLIPPEAQRGLWRDCHDTSSGQEIYITDCAASISEAEIQSILDTIRVHPDLHRHLTFWVGSNIANLSTLRDQIIMGNSVIKAIDNELGTAP